MSETVAPRQQEGGAAPARLRVVDYRDVVDAFGAGARVIIEALSDRDVVARWDQPSALEDQSVSGIAGHLARGGVWVVDDYLDAGVPAGPVTFETAGQYFASFVEDATPAGHQGIRDRGRAVAAVGPSALAQQLQERVHNLVPKLAALKAERLISVAGGAVMRLSDYLETRIVEQTVHLDDLARSVGTDGWTLPEASILLTLGVGLQVARLRHGDAALLRAVFRRRFADAVLPVL